MTPEDPRHGENRGYLAHILDGETACQPCRDAHAVARRNNWRKRYARRVDALYVDSTGTVRRIRALMAIGWRYCDIDTAAGHPSARASWAHNVVTQDKVHIDTAEKVAAVYERLCMTPGPSSRVRNLAARRGWPPPLAWDDIETDPEPLADGDTGQTVDPVVVERITHGDWRLAATPAERYAVLDLWDGSDNELERRTGWNVARMRRERTNIPTSKGAAA